MKNAQLIKRFLALLAVVLLVSAPAAALDYYVSTAGDDTNPGTFEQPFRTIQKGADVAVAGDNVYIMAGTFVENVVVRNSGADEDHRISFLDYGDGEVIVDAVIGIGMRIEPGADYMRVDGLSFINGHEGPFNGAGIRSMGDHGIFTNNVFHDNKHGIMLSAWREDSTGSLVNNQYNEIAYNVAYDNEASGVWLKRSDFTKVHHNILYQNTTLWAERGAITYYGGEGNEIYNNTLYDNLEIGIWNYNSNDPTPSPYTKTFNNIVVAPGPDDIVFFIGSMMINDPTLEYHHNLWYSLVGEPLFAWGFDEYGVGGQILTFEEFVQTASQTNPINGLGDAVADPQFVEAAQLDFNLVWGSPAIDTGPNDLAMYDPDGTRPDLGAFYFDQSGSGEILVMIEPVNPPIVIPAQGGSFSYQVTLENVSGVSQAFDAWVDVTLPVGGHFGPLIPPRSLTLAPGAALARELTQAVPAGAPEGEYTLNLYAGESSQPQFYGSDRFDFQKNGTVQSADPDQGWASEGDLERSLGSAASLEKLPSTPVIVAAYPNPFNPQTTIAFSLPEAMHVSLKVYDLSGREVASLINGFRQAGRHELTFNGAAYASGIYIYRLQAGDVMIHGKMMLMK